MKTPKQLFLFGFALMCFFLAGFFVKGQQLQKMDMVMQWQRPPEATNEFICNIRILSAGSLTYDYLTWPVLAIDTNVTSHSFFNIWENQKLAVSWTNPVTGTETTEGISPVYTQWLLRTNVPVAMTNAVEPRADPVKQSLNLWWQGPPNWQANGGMFNIRTGNPGSVTSDLNTWPIAARVTNILNIKFYNVNPTQWYAITFTNKITGVESAAGISPVTAQYNWQGL